MITEQERQSIVDGEHLRLLPIFYWVLAGMDVLFSLYGLLYVAYGVFFAALPWDEASDPMAESFPEMFAWLFGGIGAGIVVWFLLAALSKLFAGLWIRGRKRRVACLIIAGITCLWIPFGTAVGVFTFIVLTRPSVIALFAEAESRQGPVSPEPHAPQPLDTPAQPPAPEETA